MPKSKERKRWANPQLSLVVRKNPNDRRGGTRPGAGRPRKPGSVSHARRQIDGRFPLHVTLREVEGAVSLARDHLMKLVHDAIRTAHKAEFRIVQFNVLGNHIHLIVEATSAAALARGMQGFEVRIVRRLQARGVHRGKLFAARYHARSLKTPLEVRNALRYVLLNRKHHASAKNFYKGWIDPFSSAAWFDGWASPISARRDWIAALLALPAPTAPARTWLLRVGWRRHALLQFDEQPAA